MKKRMLALTAFAVLVFYFFSLAFSVLFQYGDITERSDARYFMSSANSVRNASEAGRETLFMHLGSLYPHRTGDDFGEVPLTAMLRKVGGGTEFLRGCTLTVEDGRQERLIWQGRLEPYLTEEKKAEIADFLDRCPNRSVWAHTVSFHIENGVWTPTSLSMRSVGSPLSEASQPVFEMTLQLSELPTDRTFTRENAYIQVDFYDIGMNKKDSARFRRLEEIASEFEGYVSRRNDERTLFRDIEDFGRSRLSGLVFDEERDLQYRNNEGRDRSKESVFEKLALWKRYISRLLFKDVLSWDVAALEADGEKYIYFTASLRSLPQCVLTDSAVRRTASLLGVVYALTGAFLLIAVRRLMRKNEQLDKARRALTGAAAHELKTPISVIRNQSEFVLERVMPERDAEYVSSIRDEAERMSGIVDTLLQYGRLSDRKKIEKRPLDLAALVGEELARYRAFAETNGAALRVSLAGAVPVRGNEALLRLAVDNYLSNAIRYAEGEKNVRVTLTKTKRGFRFETENECEPITKKEAKAFWSLLSKRDKARGSAGTAGMGLPLCVEIFRLHRYRYGCVPEGKSVRFFFCGGIKSKNGIPIETER